MGKTFKDRRDKPTDERSQEQAQRRKKLSRAERDEQKRRMVEKMIDGGYGI